jgi:hypothetical protein
MLGGERKGMIIVLFFCQTNTICFREKDTDFSSARKKNNHGRLGKFCAVPRRAVCDSRS